MWRDRQLQTLVLFLLFIGGCIFWFIRARYHTLYGIGIYAFVDVFLLLLIALLFTKFALRSNWRVAWNAGLIAGTVLLLVHLALNFYGKYKPTKTMVIDGSFEGCAYVFTALPQALEEPFSVDQNGIGYFPYSCGCILEMYHGTHEVNGIFSHADRNEIRFYNHDSTMMTVYDVVCYDVKKDSNYDAHERSYPYKECMSPELFEDYVRMGWIDESILVKRVWTRLKGAGDDAWQFSAQNARMPPSANN